MTTYIVDNFHDRLRNYILHRVNNEPDADDILQDVYIKIHTKSNTLQNKIKLESWLFQIVRNTIVDFYRRKKRTMEFVESSSAGNAEESENRSTENLAACLNPLINSLPENYRQALVLTDLKHVPQTHLAQQLGLSSSGAKSRVQRARQLLNNAILQCCEIQLDARGNILSYSARSTQRCS
ncbi:MAG: RNA polymerase sigma factor SigZ [Calditrichaeota bacterium]|nr:MAG: RNA polymerase sigma factor SigZ [Calditrichota bacterium]